MLSVKATMKPTRSLAIALLWGLLFAGQACNRAPTVATPVATPAPAATAEDVRIGRQAMPIDEVSFLLRGGTSQKTIIADVNRRHIPEKISAALELEFSEKGAGPGLIAALKDDKNILSKNQKDAFDKRTNDHAIQPRQNAGALQSAASDRLNAEEKEQQRLLALQRENYRNIGQTQAQQAAHDGAQVRDSNAHRQTMERQNDSQRLHNRSYNPRIQTANPPNQP
jgi:hypothetical protein